MIERRPARISLIFLIALTVAALLGIVGGTAFRWAASQRAWEILTAAFLWSLILSAGTTIARFYIERVRRGNWRRGLWLAGAQSFPLTTLFLLAASLVGGLTILPAAIPFCYVATLAVALLNSTLGVLKSPFVK